MNRDKHIGSKQMQTNREALRLGRIKDYVRQNLSADLSAAAVAGKSGMSVSSLLHLFTRYDHQTYQQYVAELRLQAALHLLHNGARVKEAMYAAGYRNRSTFNRAFKKRFGRSPIHFRR